MEKEYELSIIIPFFNEEENITNLYLKINGVIKSFSQRNLLCEVIFVDDGSIDSSIEKLIQNKDNLCFEFKIIKLSKNYGSHLAIRAGILHSKGKYTTVLSSDMQDPLNLAIELHLLTQKGYDIVYAKRKTIDVDFSSKLFSKTYSLLVKKLIFKDFPQNGVDVVMFNDKVKKTFNQSIEANSNYILQLMSLGYKYTFFEYEKIAREKGKSKWSLAKKIKLIIDSFISFSYMPIRFVSMVGVLFFLSGLGWSLYIILRKLIIGDLASGWATLISVLLLGFGITNISLGIIAEYLWRTLDASRKRPVFVIDEIIEI